MQALVVSNVEILALNDSTYQEMSLTITVFPACWKCQ